jgi:hypothetical protein
MPMLRKRFVLLHPQRDLTAQMSPLLVESPVVSHVRAVIRVIFQEVFELQL